MKAPEQPEIQRIEIHYRDGSIDFFAPAQPAGAPLVYAVKRGGKKRQKPSPPMSPEEMGLTLFGTAVEAKQVRDFSKYPKFRALWNHWLELLVKERAESEAQTKE